MARFVSPSLSQNASLNIGINYTRYGSPTTTNVYSLSSEETHHVTELFSIPIQLQYNFTRGLIQPYCYVGIGVVHKIEQDYTKINYLNSTSSGSTKESETGVSFPFGIGLEIYPTSNLIIKAELRDELFLQYPAIGLAYRFR